MSKKKLRSTAIALSLFLFVSSASLAHVLDEPQYVNAEARWQWPAGSDGVTRIPVCWENPEGFSEEIGWVKSAIATTWERASNVSFEGWGQCAPRSSGVRILITDTRPNSLLGTQLDGIYGGMELNFTYKTFAAQCQRPDRRESCVRSIAVHEFGHAIGLAHEQDRTDSTCNDTRGSRGGWYLTRYDPNSVMNYCNPRWNNDGKLSPEDIKGIQLMYGKNSSLSPGIIRVSDHLSAEKGQIWENVVVDIHLKEGKATRQFFAINDSSRSQTRNWSFFRDGVYCYDIWSSTMYSDGVGRRGFGKGCFDLKADKIYEFFLATTGQYADGCSKITLRQRSH